MGRPFVSSMCYVPLSALRSSERTALKEELTITVDRSYADPTGMTAAGEGEIEVKCYDLAVPDYIGVPRTFGFERFPKFDWVDRTAFGHDEALAFKGLKPPTPRNDQQRDYFTALANIYKSDDIEDYIAVAKTGSGKTIATLAAALKAKKPILIVVHTNRLKEQWLGSVKMRQGLRFLFGEQFVEDHVGIIQQDRCEWEGKAIGIAVIHSLARRVYPKGFYRHWGIVALDELHKMTAPLLSGAIMRMPQRIRGGMTATLREDALAKIAHWHFGPVRVQSEQAVLKPKIYICRMPMTLPERRFNTFNKAVQLNSLCENPERQALLAKLIYHRGWKRKRQVLVISDRVHQLQDLRDRVIAMGAKPARLGLYTGRVYTGRWKATVIPVDLDGTGKIRHKLTLPNGKGFLSKRDAKKAVNEFVRDNLLTVDEVKLEEEYYTLDDAWYKRMEQKCSIFFATYGVFEAGNDIARLDMGIEASPRADTRQPLGRILRDYEGKPQPEWYSPYDEIRLIKPSGVEKLITDFIKSSVTRRNNFKRGDVEIVKVRDLSTMFKGK